MAASATLDPAAAGALARIEAMLATSNAELVERLERQSNQLSCMAAEIVDLRKQVATGKACEWLSVNAAARRFDITRDEVLRAIAAGEVTSRPWRSGGGHETFQVHLSSARAAWGGA